MEKIEKRVKCDRCGQHFKPGDPVWNYRMTLTAGDFMGGSRFCNRENEEIDQRLASIINRLKLMPEAMINDQIYQEFTHFLCRACRDIVSANPLNQI